jgi:UDP-N-acetylglucosamine:LPS N-acetylglucosamine transferase
MILQQDLTGTRLAAEIEDLVRRADEVTKMETASRKLGRGNAASAVVDLIEDLLEEGRQ